MSKSIQQVLKDNSDIRYEITSEIISRDIPASGERAAGTIHNQVSYVHIPGSRYPFKVNRRLRELSDALPEGFYVIDFASCLTTNNYDTLILDPFNLPLIPEKDIKQVANA